MEQKHGPMVLIFTKSYCLCNFILIYTAKQKKESFCYTENYISEVDEKKTEVRYLDLLLSWLNVLGLQMQQKFKISSDEKFFSYWHYKRPWEDKH